MAKRKPEVSPEHDPSKFPAGNGRVGYRVLVFRNAEQAIPDEGKISRVGMLNHVGYHLNVEVELAGGERLVGSPFDSGDLHWRTDVHGDRGEPRIIILPSKVPKALQKFIQKHEASGRMLPVLDTGNQEEERLGLMCRICYQRFFLSESTEEAMELHWENDGFHSGKPCPTGGDGPYLACGCEGAAADFDEDFERWY